MLTRILAIMRPMAAAMLGFALGLVVTYFAGEDPLRVAQILWSSSFGSSYDLGVTLFYTTPLIFTGLSVAIAFHSGLFNIGAEGQLAMGALGAMLAGVLFPGVNGIFAPFLAIGMCFLFGLLWGAIPGWLRASRGSHEVINTIMLNFIALGLVSWIVLHVVPNPESQNPETVFIAPQFRILQLPFFPDTSLNVSIVLALILAFLTWVVLNKTVFGFELRAVGQNESAARSAGINLKRIRILAMALAGGMAGLVGVNEVLGSAGQLKLNFSPGYGFTGIAVALLARNHPIGIIFSALLFGALHKGTADLDLETEHITRDLSLILQAMIILCVSADGLWQYLGGRIRQNLRWSGKRLAARSVAAAKL